MKTFTLFIATLLCMFTYTEGFALSSDNKAAHITFKAETNGKKIYFQSESDTLYGYQEVKPGETITLQLDELPITIIWVPIAIWQLYSSLPVQQAVSRRKTGKYLSKGTMPQSISSFNSILPFLKSLTI